MGWARVTLLLVSRTSVEEEKIMMVMVVMIIITMPKQCNGDVGDDAVRGGSCADTNHNIIYPPHLRTFCKHIQCFCQLLMDSKIGPTN